jgi:adenosyl cobinamide kinase/adenosyl cobinamide phosphate guanylyltransferase
MSEARLTLISGGARSGKSRFALECARSRGGPVLFVATSEAKDADMATRIARHRAERPAEWETLEEPRTLARALTERATPLVVVIDCVTLWVTNLMLAPDATWQGAVEELQALLRWHAGRGGELILVSNEVGLGVVPENALARRFQDWLGSFNQRLAAEANEVYWMMAGLPVEVKSLVKRSPGRRGTDV